MCTRVRPPTTGVGVAGREDLLKSDEVKNTNNRVAGRRAIAILLRRR